MAWKTRAKAASCFAWKSRPWPIVAVIAIVLAIADWQGLFSRLFLQSTGRSINEYLSFDLWPHLLWLAFFLFTVWLFFALVRMQGLIEPQIIVNRVPQSDLLLDSPVKTLDLYGKVLEEHKAKYLCGAAESISEVEVRDCRPFLTGIRKYDGGTGRFEDTGLNEALKLHWSIGHEETISLPKHIRRLFNILVFDQNSNEPRIDATWPLRYRGIMGDPGTYRINVVVVADGISHKSEMEFTWGPTWDKVSMRIISTS